MSADCLVIHVLFILKTILKKTVIKVLTTQSFVDNPWLTHLLNYIPVTPCPNKGDLIDMTDVCANSKLITPK